MKSLSDDPATNILETLYQQNFFEWHENTFTDYITGAPGCKTKEQILEDIRQLFHLETK